MKNSIRPLFGSSLVRSTTFILCAAVVSGCGGTGGSCPTSFLPKPPYTAPETLSTAAYTGNLTNPDAAPQYRTRIISVRFTQNGNQVRAVFTVRTTDGEYVSTTSYDGIITGQTIYLQATGRTGDKIPGHNPCECMTMTLSKEADRDAYNGSWSSTTCKQGGWVTMGIGQ